VKDALRPALLSLLIFTVLCGVVYPAVIGIAALAFPDRAPALIGQPFTDPGYFWGRPSAIAYDATTSGATNLGPSSTALTDAVRDRIAALRAADPSTTGAVPVDLVTASASGLDPDISPEAALFQVPRVARHRHVDEAAVRALVEAHVELRTFGVLGEPRINVVELDRALDRRFGGSLVP
jgi:potassium-transporting ATPase KdpC subunit